MPQPYDRGLVLDSLRRRMPELSNYSDEDILRVYNRRQGLTPTGLPTIERKEAEEPPKYTPSYAPKHTGYGERFFKRFAEASLPFGLYEPEMEEAEGFAEQFSGALGSGAGFMLGAYPFAILTGGLSVPLKSAQAVTRVGKIMQRARSAAEAGKKGYRSVDEIQDWLTNSYVSKNAKNYISEEALRWTTKGTGLLGKNELYRRGLESMAANGQVRLAKALDMGIRNFATFSLYGQTHMKPNSPLEQRWSQLKGDTVTAGLFTGLGTLSTRVLFSNLTGKAEKAAIMGETFGMIGAGMYMSDLGQEDIPYEERLAHGLTLGLMHLAGVGWDKAKRKEAMVDYFMAEGHSITEAQRLVYKFRLVEDLDNAAVKFAIDSPSLFVDEQYISRKKPSHLGKDVKRPDLGDWLTNFVELVAEPKDGSSPYVLVEHFKPKKLEGKEREIQVEGEPRQEKITGKEVKDSTGKVIREASQDAMENFQRRFVKFGRAYPEIIPKKERAKVPEGITEADKTEIGYLKGAVKELKRFISSPGRTVERDYVVEDVPIVETRGDIVPKVDRVLTEKEYIQTQIDTYQKILDNKRWIQGEHKKSPLDIHLSGDLLFGEDVPWHLMGKKDILKRSIVDAKLRRPAVPEPFGEKWFSRVKNEEAKLKYLKEKIKTADNVEKRHVIVDEYGVGDWARMPLYVGEGKYTTSEAGLGRYEGKYGELTEGDFPTIPKEQINTRGLEPTSELSNVDVFATLTPTGVERLNYVAVRPGNSIPEMKSALTPRELERRYKQNIRIRELDAEKPGELSSTDLPEISLLDVLDSNYKFSLPVDNIKNIKKPGDLPDYAHFMQKTMVKRLNSAGITPEDFIKKLRKDKVVTIRTKRKSYTYHYAGERELKPNFDAVKVEKSHIKEHYERTEKTVQGRDEFDKMVSKLRVNGIEFDKLNFEEQMMARGWKLKPEYRDPDTRVWDYGWAGESLPLEYLRDPRFIESRRDIINAIVSGAAYRFEGNKMSAYFAPSRHVAEYMREVELPGLSITGRKTPVNLSAREMETARGDKWPEHKPFKSEADVRAYLDKVSKLKYPKYDEFYTIPAEANKNKPILVEQRKNALRTAEADLREAKKKDGEIGLAEIAERRYVPEKEGSSVAKKSETASMHNLDPNAGYNINLAQRLSDILDISFAKPKRLRLTKLDKNSNKLPKSRDFKRGDILKSDFALGFDTNAEAVAFARKYWKGPEAESKLAKELTARESTLEDFGKSSEYIEYGKVKAKTARVLKKANIPINVQGYKGGALLGEVLDTFFPQAKRDFNNLNTSELNRLGAMFRRNRDTDFIPEEVDILPPDNISFEGPISQKMMKMVQMFNPALPVYTVVDTAGGWAKKVSTRMMIRSSIERSLKGIAQKFSSQFLGWGKLKEKDLNTLHIELEDKFKEVRSGTEHIKEIERLKRETITVKVPKLETSIDKDTGKSVTKRLMIPENMSKYDYGIRLIRDFYDEFALAQATNGVEVYNAKTKKKNPYLEVFNDKGNKLDIGAIVPEHILQILKKEKVKGNKVTIVTEAGFGEAKIGKVAYNYYKPNFFHRALTEDFWNLVVSTKADGYLLDKIIKNDDLLSIGMVLGKDGKPRRAVRDEIYEEAKKYLSSLTSYNNNRNKIVDGQIFTRVADIDPWIYYDSNNILLSVGREPAKLYKKDGSPFEVGDTIELKNGEKPTVGKAVQTYSTDSVDIINKYASKASKSAATYGAYGKPEIIEKTEMGEAAKTGSHVLYEIERMKIDVMNASKNKIEGKKNAEFYENLIHRVLDDHIYGREQNHPYLGEYLGPKADWMIGKVTRGSAIVGLSFPLSGIKNLALGQKELAIVSGRELLRTYYKLLTDRTAWTKARNLAGQVGAEYAGVYDLFIKPATPLTLLHSRHKGLKGVAGVGVELGRETLLKTGAMRPTEMFNRIVAATMGQRMVEIHLDNLIGAKSWVTKGVPKSYSRSILEKVLRFSPKDLDLMLQKKKAGGNGYTDKQLLWAADRMHTVTQGVGDLPYIPYWMGNKGWKPFTLFYRIAYRMTDNVTKNVIQPAMYHGNIWPAMKYAGISVAAGHGLYSLYWYAFGEERKNKFKDAPASYWSNFIRAEGLGIFSNAFDAYGDSVSDAFYPVILRNMSDVTKETLHMLRGEKTTGEGIDSMLKNTVALYSGSQRVIQNLTKDTEKRVKNSKRRQAQFLDAYFKDYNPVIDAGDALTQNSPYYQSIRNVFWHDDDRLKAETYEVAINYLTDVIMRDNVALAKNPIQARKQAKSRIKNIVSRLQPMPSSWRERKKGDRTTKYKLYYSKLTPEQVREEKELEQMYRKKKREFWRAVAQYR